MKKLLLFLIVISAISCSKPPTRDDMVRKNAEDYLQSAMNDPESYEFVELILKDSVLYKDNISYRKAMFNDRIKSEERLKSIYSKDEDKIKADRNIDRNRRLITAIDSIETKLGDTVNHAASYTYAFRFRANNAMGAKTLNEYIIQTKPGHPFEIINFTDDEGKVFLTPNGFPGYDEIINLQTQ